MQDFLSSGLNKNGKYKPYKKASYVKQKEASDKVNKHTSTLYSTKIHALGPSACTEYNIFSNHVTKSSQTLAWHQGCKNLIPEIPKEFR